MNLTKTLAQKKAAAVQNIPADKLAIMNNSTNKLKTALLSKKAVSTGSILPDFNLPDVKNNKVSLDSFSNDYYVISFYRGGWCPYCNLELQALQAVLDELKSLNTALIAISPETPDHSLTTAQKNDLSFTVLSDLDNVYAKQLGLTFEMPEDLRTLYHAFNINVDKHNGNTNYELPMPSTYVINKKREIIYSFIPEDYTERLDPETILDVLKKQ